MLIIIKTSFCYSLYFFSLLPSFNLLDGSSFAPRSRVPLPMFHHMFVSNGFCFVVAVLLCIFCQLCLCIFVSLPTTLHHYAHTHKHFYTHLNTCTHMYTYIVLTGPYINIHLCLFFSKTCHLSLL